MNPEFLLKVILQFAPKIIEAISDAFSNKDPSELIKDDSKEPKDLDELKKDSSN